MERDVKYASDKKPVSSSDQKEEGCLPRTRLLRKHFSDFHVTNITLSI